MIRNNAPEFKPYGAGLHFDSAKNVSEKRPYPDGRDGKTLAGPGNRSRRYSLYSRVFFVDPAAYRRPTVEVVGRRTKLMPFRKYLKSSISDPLKVEAVSAAYEQMLSELKMVDRDDPLTELVAQYVVEAADTGERDPLKLK